MYRSTCSGVTPGAASARFCVPGSCGTASAPSIGGTWISSSKAIASRSVMPAAKSAPSDANARFVDASDDVVMPGLVDMHTHRQMQGYSYGDRQGRLWLTMGVTSTRSPGAPAYHMVEDRESIQSGARTGPRHFATGEAIDGSRIFYNFMRPVTEPGQMELELARAEALSYDMIKTYVRLVTGASATRHRVGPRKGAARQLALPLPRVPFRRGLHGAPGRNQSPGLLPHRHRAGCRLRGCRCVVRAIAGRPNADLVHFHGAAGRRPVTRGRRAHPHALPAMGVRAPAGQRATNGRGRPHAAARVHSRATSHRSSACCAVADAF